MKNRKLPHSISQRRKFIQKNVNIVNSKLLEIGALDSPTYYPEEATIRFMDRISSQQLRDKMRDHPRRKIEEIVDVHYVVNTKFFSSSIDEKFDLIIANHTIEHIADLFSWILELEKILSKNGAVFLSIPDKRFTFDILRPDTTFVDLLRCFREDLHKPSYYQILSHHYYHRMVRAPDVWSGNVENKLREKRYPLREAMAKAEELAAVYSDVHCSVFSRPTFTDLWMDMLESGIIHLEIQDIGEVEKNSNEFHVLFRLRG